MEMKQEKHLVAGEVARLPPSRGKETFLSVGGDADHRRAFANQEGGDVQPLVVEEDRRLGYKPTEQLEVNWAGAGVAGNDAADGEVDGRSLHGDLLMAALNPHFEMRPRWDNQVIRVVAWGTPTAEAVCA